MIDNKSVHSKIRIAVIHALVILSGLACLLPLWNIVAISLSGSAAVTANKVGLLPVGFTVSAYKKNPGGRAVLAFLRHFRHPGDPGAVFEPGGYRAHGLSADQEQA